MALDATDWRVSLDWVIAGGLTATNVIGISTEPGGSASDVLSAVSNSLSSEMFSAAITAADLTHIACKNYGAVPLVGEISDPAFVSGETAGQAIPQCAVVTTFGTGFAGRSNRGRSYCPAVGESAQDGGIVGTDVRAAMEAAWTAFQTDLQGIGGIVGHIVISEFTGSSKLVTSWVTHTTTGTQRRRQARQYA